MTKKESHIPPIELILDYAEGLLPSDNMESFRLQESSDEDFRNTVNGVRFMMQKGKSRMEIETYLLDLEGKSIPIRKSRTWIPYSIAASVVFVLSLAGYLLFSSTAKEIASEELAIQYPAPTIIRDLIDIDGNFMNGSILFADEKFDQAIPSFRNAVDKDPTNFSAQFYLGLCYIYKSPADLEQSIEHLEIVNQSENLLSTRARWYLALIHIKQGNKQLASPLLEQLINEKGFNHEKAEKLLSKL